MSSSSTVWSRARGPLLPRNSDALTGSVQKLQDLGAALERSKVKPDMKASGMFSRIMQGTKNLTAGKQLAYLTTHEVTLDEALNALKSGASKASKAAAAGNIMQGPTHIYDPATGTLTAIQ